MNKFRIENDQLTVTILPDRGGKISSIYLKATRSEWLDQPVSTSSDPGAPGRAFTHEEAFGFDEMFPTINAEGPVPDHGEVWSVPWTVLDASESHIDLEVKGRVYDYTFRRTLVLKGNTIEMQYRVVNESSETIPFLWTPHPLFSFFEETEILFPEEMTEIVQAIEGGMLGAYANVSTLADVSCLLRPGRLPVGTPAKFYNTRPLKTGYCGLRDHRGLLEFFFDPQDVPWLGCWINQRGWHGQKNLALEPATAPMDCPEASRQWGADPSLLPNAIRAWNLTILCQAC